MKILSTAILLIITLLFVPIFSWFFATPLGSAESAALTRIIHLAKN